ncbi:MAG TPA: DMT family transporter [Xanthobacteraceae bacterium]|nr:DMT family transporter [Xanthobacteraceae bacterium]
MSSLIPSPSANRRGIVLMIAAAGFFAANDACTKLASAYMPTSQMMAFRGVVAALVLLGILAARGELAGLRHVLNRLVLLRAGMEATIAFLYITALAFMALGDASAVQQMAPLFTTALAVVLFGARVGFGSWMAVAVGFLGVLLIVRPGVGGFQAVALLPLGAALLIALRDFVTARIAPRIPTLVVTLATAIVGSLAGFAGGGVQDWQPLGLAAYGLLACAGVNLVLGHILAIAAFRGTEPEVISPFRYANMPFAVGLGALLFGVVPDLIAIGGIALIIGAGIYNLHHEMTRKPALPPARVKLAKGKV